MKSGDCGERGLWRAGISINVICADDVIFMGRKKDTLSVDNKEKDKDE